MIWLESNHRLVLPIACHIGARIFVEAFRLRVFHENTVLENQAIHIYRHKAAKCLFRCADDRFTTYVEARVDEYGATSEFIKWYGLTNDDASDEEITTLASKLSAKELIHLGRIQRERYREVIPTGEQMTAATPTKDDDTEANPIPRSEEEIRQSFKKGS